VLVQTHRFGEIDVPDQAVLLFPDGIIGFPQLQRACLLPYEPGSRSQPGSALRWLQSLDDPALAFLTIEPFLIFPDYEIELSDADSLALDLQPTEAHSAQDDASGLCTSALCAVLTLITIADPGGSALGVSVSRRSERHPSTPPAAVTTNLLAPIVINTQTRRARQVILDPDRYLTKHLIGAQIGAAPSPADAGEE